MEWTKPDSDKFQQYLHQTGHKLIQWLKSRLPLVDGKTLEEAAMQGRGKQEAENILAEIERMASVERPPESKSLYRDVTKGLP